MTDTHAHILYGIDDGPKTLGQSIELLNELYSQGVTEVVCSSHYYPEAEPLKNFLDRYNAKFNELSIEADKIGIKLISGAEVFISRLFALEPVNRELCINKGDYILIELPYEHIIEPWVTEGLRKIVKHGIVPVIAHMEIYPAYTLELARELVRIGCLLQINASSVKSFRMRDRISKLIRDELATFIGSDTHNMLTRPPYIKKIYEWITKKFGNGRREEIIKSNPY